MKLTGENRSTRGKTCPSATLSTTNPTRTDTGSNPGLRGGRSAANRLSHGTKERQYASFFAWSCDSASKAVLSVFEIRPYLNYWVFSWAAGILTAVLLRIQVLRYTTLCQWVSGSRRFEGTRIVFVQNARNNFHKDTASYPRRHEFQEFLYCLKLSDQLSKAFDWQRASFLRGTEAGD
jgi:hypothetical protein